MANEVSFSYDQIRKQIKEIYLDLVASEERKAFRFEGIRYSFYLNGYHDRVVFKVDYLSVIPRVGEGVQIPFFKAYTGSDYFYVEKVDHVFQDNLQIVEIQLTKGFYNLYWHLRKDQALEENEVSLKDFFNLNEYDLKKKIIWKKR